MPTNLDYQIRGAYRMLINARQDGDATRIVHWLKHIDYLLDKKLAARSS